MLYTLYIYYSIGIASAFVHLMYHTSVMLTNILLQHDFQLLYNISSMDVFESDNLVTVLIT